MPFLLRTIKKPKWYKEAWLKEGKAKANALGDLQPRENKLSFWHVHDDKSNLYQVIAAIAAGRDVPQEFDYALFDQNLLKEISVGIHQTAGESFHKEADEHWHRDTVKLSAENVAEIANIIMEHGIKDRIWPSEIARLVKQGVKSGAINANPLKEKLKQRGRDNWLE